MRKSKKRKPKKTDFLRIFSLALIWILVVFIFTTLSLGYGINRVSGFFLDNYNDSLAANFAKEAVPVPENKNNQEELWSKVEIYLRNNLAAIAEAHDAGDGELEVDDISFINDDRALIFYGGGENNDQYLAEVVFGQDSENIRIERFILKVKNDNDFSGGLYGAD